jgi:hypothetical protein
MIVDARVAFKIDDKLMTTRFTLTLGYRPSALGYRLFAIGHLLLAIDHWLFAIGHRTFQFGLWILHR